MAALLAEENRKWWTLAAVAFGLFMIMLDNTVVNVALPSIGRDLHVSISSLEWVVTAYALTFAALLITGGKLGDLLGAAGSSSSGSRSSLSPRSPAGSRRPRASSSAPAPSRGSAPR